jgi:ribosomal protein L40E
VFCRNCGSQLNADAAFCRSCGSPVRRELETQEDVSVTAPPTVGQPAHALPPTSTDSESTSSCPTCGSKLNPEAAFCRFCGSPAQHTAGPETAATVPFAPQTPQAAATAVQPLETAGHGAAPAARHRALKTGFAIVFSVVAILAVATLLLWQTGVISRILSSTKAAAGPAGVSVTSSAAIEATGGAAQSSIAPTSGASQATGAVEDAPASNSSAPQDLSVIANLSASSVLKPQGSATYGPKNLVDGDPATCWSPADGRDGVGQSVDFKFGSDVTVTEVQVVPGYYKKDKKVGVDRWLSNARLKRMRLVFSDGTSVDFGIRDDESASSQTFVLPAPKKTQLVQVVVVDSYAPQDPYYGSNGRNYATHDLSVGELHLVGLQ